MSRIYSLAKVEYMNVNTESAGLGYVLTRNYEQDNDVIALGSLIGTYLNQHHLSMENFLSALKSATLLKSQSVAAQTAKNAIFLVRSDFLPCVG